LLEREQLAEADLEAIGAPATLTVRTDTPT
jgi:hypothetical protein